MGSSPPAREQQADHSIKLCKFAMTQGPMTVILGSTVPLAMQNCFPPMRQQAMQIEQ
jgi:hypothetical protein